MIFLLFYPLFCFLEQRYGIYLYIWKIYLVYEESMFFTNSILYSYNYGFRFRKDCGLIKLVLEMFFSDRSVTRFSEVQIKDLFRLLFMNLMLFNMAVHPASSPFLEPFSLYVCVVRHVFLVMCIFAWQDIRVVFILQNLMGFNITLCYDRSQSVVFERSVSCIHCVVSWPSVLSCLKGRPNGLLAFFLSC